MRKQLIFLSGLFVFAFFISCEKDLDYGKISESTSQEEDNALLTEIREDIIRISNSKQCTDPSEWEFTELGSKACGGPVGYIAFNRKIDVKEFLKIVDYYNHQQAVYNEKWSIVSDCSLPPEPKWIDCENSKPVFKYN